MNNHTPLFNKYYATTAAYHYTVIMMSFATGSAEQGYMRTHSAADMGKKNYMKRAPDEENGVLTAGTVLVSIIVNLVWLQ